MMLLEVPTAVTGITPFIWMVTGIGFLLVLALLFVFVYIMKLMGWIMQPRVKPKGKDAETHAESVAHTQKDYTERITLTADSTAAIALALHLYYHGVHDEESTKTIVQPHRTQWNNKMYGMNNLHR